MNYVNKTVFLNYTSCPVLGWKTKRGMLPRLEGLNNELLVFEGKQVHKISRSLFAGAQNAQKSGILESAAYTGELLQNPQNKIILEASFISGGYCLRCDAIERNDDGSWNLYEVKSGSKYKAKYVYDMSFSSMVLQKSGLKINKAVLMHLSNEYRLGMDSSKLFSYVDCTQKVSLKTQEFLEISESAAREIESDLMPEPSLRRNCKNCPLFDGCMGKDVKDHIFNLPRLSVLQLNELIEMGADTVDKIPDSYELTPMQQIVKNSMLSGGSYISQNLQTELDLIKPPYYYLDFESVTTIMPLYPDIAPHTQLLTQFSIDKSVSMGTVCDHFEYIADHTKDCRFEIAEKLTQYLGEEGSIITYANFEKIAILRLASMFSDLSEKLLKIAARITDLEVIVRKNYYDINFHGRSSIKKVLPVMIANMNYEGLEIGAGGDAAAAFAFMAMGLYDEEKIKTTKESLLKYCAQDTFAMVKIHEFLTAEVAKEIR
ncbi:MAG: DUF2779 domain-containing protein [Endomicrobium sp.]|jgi:hypothetical protein|nr:DUF2779 domain-containing protein [Endomicrobium sp.]